MKRLDARLITPIYAKTLPQSSWPQDSAFYSLSSNGLFLCRNTRFYRSCVRARRPPGELAPQQESLEIDFPRMPSALLEQAVGFFDWAYRQRAAESVLLLAWNETRQEAELIAPDQVASSYRNSRGEAFAMSVRYEIPHPVPDNVNLFGDIHSHCDMPARASYTDRVDEERFNGLHMVAGLLDREPPQWHLEAAVDGARFAIDPHAVLAGYRCRDHNFPTAWCDRHRVEYTSGQEPSDYGSMTGGDPYASYGSYDTGARWDDHHTHTSWGGKPLSSFEARSNQNLLPSPPKELEEPPQP